MKEYVCVECGAVVVIEQDVYDSVDLDNKCEACYYEE